MDTQLSAAPTIQLPAVFSPLFEKHRYKVFYGGRGGGKSWGIAIALILLASQQTLRILCTRELQGSISESVHELLKQQILALGLGAQFIIENKSIRNTITGSEFFFEGIRHNINKIRSFEGVDIVWVEEAAQVTKNSWAVLIPTIRKAGSEIWLSFNPDLETDYTYDHFVKHPRTNSVVVRCTYKDNPFLSSEVLQEIEDCKADNYDDYLWIWEGHCRTLTEGSVYGEELVEAVQEDRLTRVPYRPGLPVTTYWDLGRRGMTSIIFTQTYGGMEHIIRSYENRKKNLNHYWTKMQSFGYFYGYCVLPHDAKHERLGMKASIEKQFKDANWHVKVVPVGPISTGIEAVRNLFPFFMFDFSNCEDLITALRKYRYDIVESIVDGIKTFSKEPLKDGIHDHYADALRMKAMAHLLWPTHTTKFATPIPRAIDRSSGAVEVRRMRGLKAGRDGAGWMRG